jgi:hypothetical protein
MKIITIEGTEYVTRFEAEAEIEVWKNRAARFEEALRVMGQYVRDSLEPPTYKPTPTQSDHPMMRVFMQLCPTCGNKRCPRAKDGTLECTNSNEPGQPGSAY